MNKETAYKLLLMIASAYFGLGVLKITPYLIILLLVLYFAYDFLQGKEQIEKRIKLENKELLHEIKTSTKDAYLKHKQLLTMVSNIPSPLLLLDVKGNVVLYNNAFNLLRDTSVERKLDYIKNDCKREVAEFLKDAFIFEIYLEKVIRLANKTYQAISIPVTTQSKFSGCVILFQDITKAKVKESMQKQFIADASHELKTPISVIKGMVEILNRQDFNDDNTRDEFMAQIEKETYRLEIIVRDLLQLSRLSVENLIVKEEWIDITQLIDYCVDSFTVLAKDKGIKIVKSYESKQAISIDKELTITLINNLISNAIKYSEDGVITINTQIQDHEYVLSFHDEGDGMSAEDCDKVFERFYRVDKARSRDSGGSGLGLPIVKSIVEAHDGRIEVESELGKGSTFKIYFKR